MKSAISKARSALKDFLQNTMGDAQLESEVRQDDKHADVSFSCHNLAKLLENDGQEKEIAQWVVDNLKVPQDTFSAVKAEKGYVNFYLNRPNFIKQVLEEAVLPGYGSSTIGGGKQILVDYSAPNIGKPLHIGHIRSTIIGDSVIKILTKAGYSPYGINYLGDIGLHLGKVIYSYKRHLDEANLQANPERELARLYVMFGKEHQAHLDSNKASLEKMLTENPDEEDSETAETPMLLEAKEIVNKIEAGDPENVAILKRIHASSMIAFERIYSMLGIKFDEVTGQSKYSEKGKEVVMDAIKKGVAKYNPDGSVVVEGLTNHGLPPKVILRKDGTAIYSTQDLGTAVSRFEKYNPERIIYVVANEQDTYFKQIFKILGLLGYDESKLHHLSFGMINLAEEKMSSRKGNIIYLEDVLNKSVELSEKLISADVPEEKKKEIAQNVGIGAMKYMVLRITPLKSMVFSWETALDLNSNTSPYIQYSHARAASVLSSKPATGYFNPADLSTDAEFALVKKIAEYPLVVEKAALSLKPNLVAAYSYDLAKAFTRFYHDAKIIGSSEQESRLYLANAFSTVLKDSMSLLGIKMPERM
jgi:arginyl-tRNA synthetase